MEKSQHETARVSEVPVTSVPTTGVPAHVLPAGADPLAVFFAESLNRQAKYLADSVARIENTINAQAAKFHKALEDSQKMDFWDYTLEAGKILLTAGAVLIIGGLIGRDSTDELVA